MEQARICEGRGWVESEMPPNLPGDVFCPTQDVFQSRLAGLVRAMTEAGQPEGRLYLMAAVTGEIGNNSFDHNLGRWPDSPGIYFSHGPAGPVYEVVLADRGLGVWGTLRRVRPELRDDREALRVAFTEKVSGRAPENRGNGLKFVREAVRSDGLSLVFHSGGGRAELDDDFRLSENPHPFRGCLAVLRTR